MNTMTAAMNAVAGAPQEPAPATALAGLPAPMIAGTLPFEHWIALDGALPDVDPALATGEAPAAAPEDPAEPADDTLALEAPALDALLAAMTPQAAPAALPAMMMAMPGAKAGVADQAAATDAPPDVDAPLQAAARSAADVPALPLPLPAATPAAPAAPRVELAAAMANAPAPAPAAPVPAANAASTTPAAPAAAVTVAAEADGADAASTATATTPTTGAAAATGQAATMRGADSVTLAGPPAAWRQTLHEALGERLQLQLGRGQEQATIRLEPPMLGRIDISVRHSGGNLEVHIAASNSEVLRQLNTVSDSLRNDLAGRQYANVAVSVSETPRAQASSQAGQQPSGQPGADAQGRGRQQEQEEQRQRTPGLALNDAGDAGSLFSMNERERP
ncbi:flagellar hook-length control protein FliK [Telluria beijingensis]|uniref:flagellar hook-length control protein FliK n=1 Tax=Telluria beijingensis TaxID=3068633 RepID=UPI0027961379|nr:flagellar hook-length control protein FliK [Massilia sp. REN29]